MKIDIVKEELDERICAVLESGFVCCHGPVSLHLPICGRGGKAASASHMGELSSGATQSSSCTNFLGFYG